MVLLERAMIELSSLVASVTLRAGQSRVERREMAEDAHINELGFFFFLRIAVETSFSTCGGKSVAQSIKVAAVENRHLRSFAQRQKCRCNHVSVRTLLVSVVLVLLFELDLVLGLDVIRLPRHDGG